MTLIKSISGIRGTIGNEVGESLSPVDIVRFTAAFGNWVVDQTGVKKIVIGRDARESGEMVNDIVVSTLLALGINVVNIGLAPTPTVELAVVMEKAGGGIVITASHNPAQWNALKLLNDLGEFISEEAGLKVLDLAEKDEFEFVSQDKLGTYSERDKYIATHIDKILALPLIDVKAIKSRKFKIAVDCINSVGGISVPLLLRKLGVKEIHELNCEPTGKFAHDPEPLPDNLQGISNEVTLNNADLGLVVDPDVDRLAIVCEDGTMFGEEYSLVSIADYVLGKEKGSLVSNLSSTNALKDIAEKHGSKFYASAVGEVNVVAMMKEKKAVIGGEGNGGIIVPSFHYGRDALVGIALFLSHLAKYDNSCSSLRATYPNYHMFKNKILLENGIDADKILNKIKIKYKSQPINTVDGVKIEFDSEWVHLRKSNTEPIIRIYTEGTSETTAENIAKKLLSDITDLIKEFK